jgi:hypothetical protein
MQGRVGTAVGQIELVYCWELLLFWKFVYVPIYTANLAPLFTVLVCVRSVTLKCFDTQKKSEVLHSAVVFVSD